MRIVEIKPRERDYKVKAIAKKIGRGRNEI